MRTSKPETLPSLHTELLKAVERLVLRGTSFPPNAGPMVHRRLFRCRSGAPEIIVRACVIDSNPPLCENGIEGEQITAALDELVARQFLNLSPSQPIPLGVFTRPLDGKYLVSSVTTWLKYLAAWILEVREQPDEPEPLTLVPLDLVPLSSGSLIWRGSFGDPQWLRASAIPGHGGPGYTITRRGLDMLYPMIAGEGTERRARTAHEAECLLGDSWATVRQLADLTGLTAATIRTRIVRGERRGKLPDDIEKIPERTRGAARYRYRIAAVWPLLRSALTERSLEE